MDNPDLFIKLLNQLQMTDSVSDEDFKSGLIDEINVHEKSNCWDFLISLNNILPYKKIYRLL